jgi:hypothetical protein
MSWLTQIADNLLPLSLEQNSLTKAISEWEYRGDTYDLGSPHETCQLCNHPDIRYQFEIVNKNNGNELLVGSECIKKFSGIAVLDSEGNALPSLAAKQKVDSDKRKLILDAQTRSLLNSLVELSRKEEEFDIVSFEEDYKKRGAFTPKQLATLIWRFEKYKVPFNKAYFGIYIRRQKDKEALLGLKDFQLRKMLPCLSPSQRDFLAKKGRHF